MAAHQGSYCLLKKKAKEKNCQGPVSGNPLLCAMNPILTIKYLDFIPQRAKNENSLIWNMCFYGRLLVHTHVIFN